MLEIDPKLQILILSAEQDTCLHLKTSLRKNGFGNIAECTNGIEALALCAKKRPDLVICDFILNMIDGWLFVKEFKNSDKIANCPVVMMGKAACTIAAKELKDYGVLGFMKLPIDMKKLMELITATLKEHRTEGSLEQKYSVAKTALLEKKTDIAIEKFKDLYAATSQNERSSVGMFRAFEQGKKTEEAKTVLIHLQEISDSPSVLVLNLKSLLAEKKLDEAKETVAKIIKGNGNSPYFYLASLTQCLGAAAWDLAESICVNAAKMEFRMPEFQVAMAKIHYSRGDVESSLKVLIRVSKTFGQNLEALNLEGVCRRSRKDFDGAKRCYEQALLLSPMDTKIIFNLGLVFTAAGDTEGAIQQFETCLKLAPNFIKAKEKIVELRQAGMKKTA